MSYGLFTLSQVLNSASERVYMALFFANNLLGHQNQYVVFS